MATSEGQTEGGEKICCSVCLDIYQRPRRLPCSHSFCHECLVKCAEKTDQRQKFCCPLCRVDTKADTSNISRAGIWVTRFPVNYELLTLAQKERTIWMEEQPGNFDTPDRETASTFNEQSPKNKLRINSTNVNNNSSLCKGCLRDETHVPATVYCRECSELLCGDCKRHHTKNKFTSGHIVIDMKGDLSETKSFDYVNKLTKCHYHPTEEVKYLCKDHDQLCCNECAVITHRRCSDIVSLADEVAASRCHKRIDTDVEKVERHASALAQHELEYSAALDQSERCIKDELKCIKFHLDDAYRLIEESIIRQFNFTHAKRKELVSVQLYNIETLKASLNLSKEKISATEKFGQELNVYLMERKMRNEMEQHVNILKQLHQSANIVETYLAGKDLVAGNLMKSLLTGLSLTDHMSNVGLPAFPSFETQQNTTETVSHQRRGHQSFTRHAPNVGFQRYM
ncbi:tripartite motif-containing protein 45-like [Mercenaria mercenaria]|uniref:tripartite motif-containing protein 45-like n=1 Tax=Mercenaria mercenaria TaxID=6596 RepID=UPI00234E501A|nr:tripartite motif-containing protein 45-like [Mercenaria mercenaria]